MFKITLPPSTVQGLLTFRLIFGCYYKASNSAIISGILKVYCVIYIALIFHIPFVQYFSNDDVWTYLETLYVLTMLIEMTVNVCISLITNGDSLIKNLSSSPSLGTKYLTRFIIYASIFIEQINFLLFVKIFGVMSCIVYELQVLSINFGRLDLVYTVEHYHKTVKDLCKTLKDKLEAENNNDVEKRRHVEDFIVEYMVTSNNLDRTVNLRRAKMITACFCEFSKVIIAVNYVCYSVISDPAKRIVEFFELSLSIFAMSAPMIIMESAANYLDETKILLTEELLTYKDNILRDTVHDALEYIDKASSKYTIWSGFPANLSFVICFLNLTISYIIATLQFLY